MEARKLEQAVAALIEAAVEEAIEARRLKTQLEELRKRPGAVIKTYTREMGDTELAAGKVRVEPIIISVDGEQARGFLLKFMPTAGEPISIELDDWAPAAWDALESNRNALYSPYGEQELAVGTTYTSCYEFLPRLQLRGSISGYVDSNTPANEEPPVQLWVDGKMLLQLTVPEIATFMGLLRSARALVAAKDPAEWGK